MKPIQLILLIGFLTLTFSGFAQKRNRDFHVVKNKIHFSHDNRLQKWVEDNKHKKGVAAILDITLGVFAVHRMYLGTKPKVPVIYTLTLGGGGFLVLADLGIIIFTKDLENYRNKGTILMWGN